MKKRYFLILLLIMIVSLLFSNNVNYVNASSNDLEYDFENDILYSGSGNFPNSTYNTRNQTIYTQHYNSTYSFENDDNGNIPVDWNDNSGTGCTAIVIWNKEIHNKVFQLYDGSNSEKVDVNNSFTGQTSEIIELWWMVSDSTELQYIKLTESGSLRILMRIHGGNLEYHDGAYQTVISIQNNIWYHIRIDFNCNTDTCDIYVNGIKYIDDLDFTSVANIIDGITLYTDPTYTDFYNYFDAIGYSWNESYNLGMNMIPYSYINESIQEIDKFEFAYYNNSSLYPQGYDNPEGWTDIEVGGNDKINVWTDPIEPSDMGVYYKFEVVGVMGIEKEFNINEGVFNISLSFWYLTLINANGYLNISIYSNDDTQIVRLWIVRGGSNVYLYYWNGNNNIQLYQFIEADLWSLSYKKHFNIYVNEFCRVIFYYDSVYKVFTFPLIEYKEGLSKVEVLGSTPDITPVNEIFLDSLGIYINGSSLAESFANMACNLSEMIPYWNLLHNNLLTLNAKGVFAFRFFRYEVYTIIYETNMTDFIEYNNTDVLFNLYDNNQIQDVHMSYLFNSSFIINSMLIEGVKLTESLNEYWLEFEYENIDISESYFYVIDNKLYFTMSIQESEQLEYIRASFDVNDLSSTERSIIIYSNFNGDSVAGFTIDYLGGLSDLIILPNYPTSKQLILSQGKVIGNFSLLITDNNLNTSYGISSGYVSSFTLKYLPDIQITILTLKLIDIIIPLLVILLPTIVVYIRLGKNVIIPMMLLMSLICVMTGLIPIWLFIIMCLGFMAFIITDYKNREV